MLRYVYRENTAPLDAVSVVVTAAFKIINEKNFSGPAFLNLFQSTFP
jgi:hypothetical protein